MDPVTMSALIGAGSSLFGSLMNSSSLSSANANNMMMNTGGWKAQQIQSEAGALGVSPLAILQGGSSGGVVPFQAGSPGSGVIQAGQNIARAVAASDSGASRLQKLQEQHLALVNAGLEADVVQKQAHNSLTAVSHSTPVPAFQQFVDPRDPTHPWWARTKEYAESSFSGDPVQMVRGAASSLADAFKSGDFLNFGHVDAPRLPDWMHGYLVRPDILRSMQEGISP